MKDAVERDNIRAMLRPNIAALKPYSSARDDFGGQADVWLDANENPKSLSGAAGLNRYPSARHQALRDVLAQIFGLPTEQVFAGHGSDEAIDLLMRAFCSPGEDRVLSHSPSYGMYSVSAAINDLGFDAVQLQPDFSLDVQTLQDTLKPSHKLIFICSPNNPTGNTFSRADIQTILEAHQGLVVVDEAYIDFAPEESVLPLLETHSNLVVLRTFSKAWGLAGLRLGCALAHPAVIEVLMAIKPPYNLNQPTLEIAEQLLQKQQEMKHSVQALNAAREKLARELESLKPVEEVFPSVANFLLVRVKQADALYHFLLDQGVVVRNRSSLPGCTGCLRFTVGTALENEKLITQIKAFNA